MRGQVTGNETGAFWGGRDFPPKDIECLTECSADWLWETDASHRFTWISPGFEQITGIAPARLVGRSHLKFVAGSPHGAGEAFDHTVLLEKHEPFRDFIYQLRQADPGSRWVAASGVPRFDAEGVFIGYRGIGRNVTGYLAMQAGNSEAMPAAEPCGEAERSAAADLRLAIDAMNMGIIVVDRNLDAEIINKAFYSIWKIPPDDAPQGCSFRHLMEINRHSAIYDVADGDWDSYTRSRLAEIRAGDVPPREFRRADGCTVIYSVIALSGERRLICYYDISELKMREAELAEALEKARLAEAVIDSVPNPIFVKDRKLSFVLVNQAFARLFGKVPYDMVGGRAADFLPADLAAGFETSEREVLETGRNYQVEEDFEAAGVNRSRIVRKHRVSIEGRNDYVAGTIFDVTEIKQRERDAEEARRQLADVLETLPAGVVIYDRDDRFMLANRKVHDALPAMECAMRPGRPLREAIEAAHAAGYFRVSGDAGLDSIYDSDAEAWISRYIERYHARQHVFERKNPDGRWFKAFDTRTEDGTFIGVRVDITEQKEREEELRRSMGENELFRNLIDNVPVAIYAKYPDLRLMYVNKGWCELTGYTAQEATGKTDAEIFGPQGEAYMDGDRAVLATGETSEMEENATAADGSQRYQIARKSVMSASDGSLYLIGSTTDITELRLREEELRVAQEKAVLADRAKSEFLANMSHEIRTPMNGVLGMAELLAQSELDPKQRTFTDIIVKSGNALLTIINDILDFSKIDAGQLVLDPAPFNLAEAIEDVATLVSTRAKEKDLELIVRIDPSLPSAFVGDVGRIRQIVTNLLGNAVKFTEKGHVLVEVSGEAADNASTKLQFSVVDTGIGIPKDKLALVFDKFSQVDSSSTRRHEGTGLGLAITSRLLALMEGDISVDSEEGRGSTFAFTVTLPNASRPGGTVTAPVDVTGARVLIIDDNAVNRSILLEQMTRWGFDACAAESGEEGLKVLAAAARCGVDVDCVILDYQMPGMTGAEVARAMRAHADSADTPIVMLTSVDQSLSAGNYRDLAIEAQLVKPARSSALLETIVATIQKRHAAPAVGDAHDEPETAPPPQAAEVSHSTEATAPGGGGIDAAHGIDVLVAEDNEVNQLVFTQILQELGYRFEIAGNGALALAAYRKAPPRLILMDVSMPQMNGLEAAGAIREIERESGRHVPIIGVTAHALKGDRERCINAGMDDYLSKPISPKALTRKLAQWMGGNQAEKRA